MNVISKAGLMKLAKKHPAAVAELTVWYRIARRSDWTQFADVRATFPGADQVGRVLIFDVCHNDFRLIATIDYPTRRIFVKDLMTHKEYDRKEWMRWVRR